MVQVLDLREGNLRKPLFRQYALRHVLHRLLRLRLALQLQGEQDLDRLFYVFYYFQGVCVFELQSFLFQLVFVIILNL